MTGSVSWEQEAEHVYKTPSKILKSAYHDMINNTHELIT